MGQFLLYQYLINLTDWTPFDGPPWPHAADGPRQKSISAYIGFFPGCSHTQILVPHSYNQSALGCRSIRTISQCNDILSLKIALVLDSSERVSKPCRERSFVSRICNVTNRAIQAPFNMNKKERKMATTLKSTPKSSTLPIWHAD